MPRHVREQLILEVAGTVFARDGYHAGSMDEIARLADVSKPMLYAYFGSKEGLYVAYIDRTGRELLDRLRDAAPRRGDPQGLRAPIMEFLAFVEQYRDGWKVLFSELASSRPLADEVAQLRRQIAETVRSMFATAGPEADCLSAPAADAIAHAIVGAGESLANWWLEHPDVAREDVADWYVGVVTAAVAAAFRSPADRR